MSEVDPPCCGRHQSTEPDLWPWSKFVARVVRSLKKGSKITVRALDCHRTRRGFWLKFRPLNVARAEEGQIRFAYFHLRFMTIWFAVILVDLIRRYETGFAGSGSAAHRIRGRRTDLRPFFSNSLRLARRRRTACSRRRCSRDSEERRCAPTAERMPAVSYLLSQNECDQPSGEEDDPLGQSGQVGNQVRFDLYL